MYQRNRGINHFLLSLIGALSAFILVFSPILSIPPTAYAEGIKVHDGNSLGDLNGDGEINLLDLILLKLVLLDRLPANGNSDVDDNGRLNLLDPDALVSMFFPKSPSPRGGGGGGGGGHGGPGPTITPTPPVTPPPTYTVTFDSNGGSGSMTPQAASAPTALTSNSFTRTCYSFAGWNTLANGTGTAYADGATYAFGADVTLYAQWTSTTYTVTFDSNGGSGSMTPQAACAPTALTTNTFTRASYSFSNWNTLANGTGTAYADGATYAFGADVTLYAQWTPDGTYTVTFDSNGGSGSMTPQAASAPTALTSNSFTRTCYSFTGWNTLANGTGTAYADGATYAFGADVTLYAQWTSTTYTVTFDSNGGSGSMTPQAACAPTALTSNSFTRTCYSFTGWNTLANGTGTAYADGATYGFGADVTLYAQWTSTTYTVTFDSNGGSGSMTPQAACAPTALTTNTFTRASYSFSNWNTLANGTGTAYADGATYAFGADVTLYAQWTPDGTYTVTFDSNGGSGSMTPQAACAPTALTTNTFTRTCYSFTGWNTLANGTGTAYADGATYAFGADVTLYAQWTSTTYTVTFNSNGGSGSMTPQAACAPTALTTNTFTLTCYSFTGWNTLANGTGTAYADGATYGFGADVTLYAQWTINTFSLTTAAGAGGSVNDPGEGTFGPYNCGTVVDIVAEADTNYDFVEWTGDVGTIGDSSLATTTITMNNNYSITATFESTGPICPDAITNLTVMPEADGGFEWDSIRLTWTAPSNSAVDSYIVKYSTSGTINEGNWAGATTATTTFASIKAPGVTQNCTVTGLTEGQLYYFAVKCVKSGCADSAISDDSPSATALQPDHEVGDWWMYKEYYNSTSGVSNKAYFITNVIQTGATTNVFLNSADYDANTPESTGPCAVVNKWVDERNVTDGTWGRQRIVPAPVVSWAANTIHHVKIWTTDDDWTQWVKILSLPQSFTTFGTGVFPSTQHYYTGTNSAPVAWSGAQSNGYPYSNTESFGWYEFIHANDYLTSGTTHRHFYKDYTWTTGAWVASYDVSTASSDADARGIGTYGVWPLTINDVWVGGDAVNDADTIAIWYSPDAHNFVRQLDQIRYRGREDSAIVAYEVRDFQKSNLQVSGWGGATLTVSIDVTNTLDETCNFNLLCTLTDTDALCTGDTDNHPYINGQLMYPSLGTNPSGTWPYYDAIKQTGNLAPGATTTVTWTISVATSGANWLIWCAGLTDTP